jgi:beta-barrel assembly-enhancing protease
MIRQPFARMRAAIVGAVIIGTSAVFGVGVSGCKGGRFPNMLSKSQEMQLGQEAKTEYDRELSGQIVTSGPQYDRLMRVADKILPLARRDYDVPFNVQLVRSKQINAFALPGGPMYFYTGLMELAESDDEIASVLGHEASHIVKRHSAQQISDAMVKQNIASVAFGRSSSLIQSLASLGLQLHQLSYSRGDESQADEVGFKYLVEAGYDPDAMASFFEKMGKAAGSGGGTPEFLQSHPVTSKRVEAARKRATQYKAGEYKP